MLWMVFVPIKGVLLRFVIKELKLHKSPEQISGILLKLYLRSQKGKYRRRRGTKIKEKERELKKKRRIDERPSIVERRGRVGDWEGDTVLGKDKRVRIVTYVDRRTGYLVAFLLPRMNAELLTSLTLHNFKRIPRSKKKTITFDNGIEFSDWGSLEEKSKVDIYFAYPYHSWERGTN
jgi:IS30 family transposase